MLEIPLSPEKEARLRARAEAVGKDVAEYVLQVVEDDLAVNETPSGSGTRTQRGQWETELDAWAEGHPRRSFIVDDSRESIYLDRGE